jgi:hypothetical protein
VSPPRSLAEVWEELGSYSDTYTCYSAAVATWLACEREDWPSVLDAGLWLTVAERPGGLFAFGHFPPDLRATLGLVRTGSGNPSHALAGVLSELAQRGRVIVAGDGFRLPWHVAFGRRHVPHWFVLIQSDKGPTVVDPFACRNELGVQDAHRATLSEAGLARLLEALPGGDPVLALRESLALGDETVLPDGFMHQWFIVASADGPRQLAGAHGADAVSALASHFRERGQDPLAYRQADDIWSIARHRAFHCRHAEDRAQDAGDEALATWVAEHGRPVARKWAHLAPLMMQATLALRSGRRTSESVPATLEQLAELERSAAAGHPLAGSGMITREAALPFDPVRRP